MLRGEAEGGRAALGRWVTLAGPVVAWALLLALAAWVLTWTGRLQRAETDRSFAQRTAVAADFTRTYLIDSARRQQQDGEQFLTGRTVSQHELELYGSGFGYAGTGVFDAAGRALRTWPAGQGATAPGVSGNPEDVRMALNRDRIVVSDVYLSQSLQQPLVAVTYPIRTPYGRRVFSGSFIVAGSPLGVYVREAVVPAGGRAFYIDRAGNIAAATTWLGPGLTPLSRLAPRLETALRHSPDGRYSDGTRVWRYTSAGVGAIGWRLVIEVPEKVLYAHVEENQQRFAIVVLAVAILGFAAAVTLGTTAYRRREVEWRLRRLNRQYARQAADLRAINEELESFSASVAHDLRAPLRAMGGYSEILIDEYVGAKRPQRMADDEAARLLGRIWSGAVRMSELIDALLAFSRLQRQEIRLENVDLTALAGAAWESLIDQRAGREIVFRLGELPACQGDSDLVRQVLVNLLDNAIKFTRDRRPAHIEVSGRPGPDGYVTCIVRDDGAGFDPRHADQLFKPFHRLHPPGAYPGTGIGLSLVQRIIARHSGQITAESAPGEGTSVTFTLPAG